MSRYSHRTNSQHKSEAAAFYAAHPTSPTPKAQAMRIDERRALAAERRAEVAMETWGAAKASGVSDADAWDEVDALTYRFLGE